MTTLERKMSRTTNKLIDNLETHFDNRSRNEESRLGCNKQTTNANLDENTEIDARGSELKHRIEGKTGR